MLGGQLFDTGLSGFSQNDGKASLQLCIYHAQRLVSNV